MRAHSPVVLLIVVFFALMTPRVVAQTACPYGVNPGSSSCGPGPEIQNSVPVPPPQPSGWWESSFGAMAADVPNNAVGTAQAFSSRDEAERAAEAECRSNGGQACEVVAWAENRCLAMAWPNGKGGGVPATASGKTKKEVDRKAMKLCVAHDGKCEVLVSICNEPKFHKY